MIPHLVALALQADGWWLRQEIIWGKPNPMPESTTDRCTKSHEQIFLLSKRPRYYFDAKAIAEERTDWNVAHGKKYAREYIAHADNAAMKTPTGNNSPDIHARPVAGGTRNRRSVWTVATAPFSQAHFATFPPALIEPCILAGCPIGGRVLDPFAGAGTTGLVADRLQRRSTMIELNPEYAAMAQERIEGDAPLLGLIDLPAAPEDCQ
jgi:DNA modification methylase